MSIDTSGATPAGWYPDPAGEPQWRVWTGTQWSAMTRSYNVSRHVPDLADHLSLVRALARVRRLGVFALSVGTALLVSALAYWPGQRDAAPRAFAEAALAAGIALLVVAWIVYADAARVLLGRWALWALLPGVNVLVVTGATTLRLGGRAAPRVVATIIFFGLYGWQFHVQHFLCVVPVFIVFDQYRWAQALIDRVTGTAPSTRRSAVG